MMRTSSLLSCNLFSLPGPMPARVHLLLLEVYLSQAEVAKCPQRLSPLCSLSQGWRGWLSYCRGGEPAAVRSYFGSADGRVWILMTAYPSSFPEHWNGLKGLKHPRTIGVVWKYWQASMGSGQIFLEGILICLPCEWQLWLQVEQRCG